MGQTELPDKGRLACSLGLLKPPVFSLLPFFFCKYIVYYFFVTSTKLLLAPPDTNMFKAFL